MLEIIQLIKLTMAMVVSRALGHCLRGKAVARISSSALTRSIFSSTSPVSKKAWDGGLADEYKFWNREESTSGQAQMVLDMSPESIQKEARILCLAADDDEANNVSLLSLEGGL